jgi:hypothetical protein
MSDVPGDGSPRRSEEEDVNANEGDTRFLSSHVVDDNVSKIILTGGGGSQDGNEKLRDAHANSAHKQDRASSPLVNGIETGNCRTDIDTAGNQTDNKLILEPRVLEELSAVVEDEVNASQLLKRLEETSSKKTLSKVTLETFDVASASNTHLVLVVCLNLGKFIEQSRIISGETSQFGQASDSTFVVISLDQVAGCFRKDQHADYKDNGPCELDGDWDAIRTGIITSMGGVVHNSCQQKTNCDSELVRANNEATDPFGGSLGLVKGDCSTNTSCYFRDNA